MYWLIHFKPHIEFAVILCDVITFYGINIIVTQIIFSSNTELTVYCWTLIFVGKAYSWITHQSSNEVQIGLENAINIKYL